MKKLITTALMTAAIPAVVFAASADDKSVIPDAVFEDGFTMTTQHDGTIVEGDAAISFNKGLTYDPATATVTMPLRQGSLESGETVWYIVTEASDAAISEKLGTGFSAKLANSDVNNLVRSGRLDDDGNVVFDAGGVDFSPERALTPGDAPAFFPPKDFNIGALGDDDYTPLVKVDGMDGSILNAPTVAFDVDADALNAMCDGDADASIVHDRITKICPRDGTVTMKVNLAKYGGTNTFLFMSTEVNHDLVSVLEAATYAPRLKGLATENDDDAASMVEQNYVTVNGQIGADNPERQGINSAIADGLSVIDVLGGATSVNDEYSPLWNIYPVVWNQKAVDEGAIKRLSSEAEVLAAVEAGYIGGLDGDFGPGGFNVNCPVVARLN